MANGQLPQIGSGLENLGPAIAVFGQQIRNLLDPGRIPREELKQRILDDPKFGQGLARQFRNLTSAGQDPGALANLLGINDEAGLQFLATLDQAFPADIPEIESRLKDQLSPEKRAAQKVETELATGEAAEETSKRVTGQEQARQEFRGPGGETLAQLQATAEGAQAVAGEAVAGAQVSQALLARDTNDLLRAGGFADLAADLQIAEAELGTDVANSMKGYMAFLSENNPQEFVRFSSGLGNPAYLNDIQFRENLAQQMSLTQARLAAARASTPQERFALFEKASGEIVAHAKLLESENKGVRTVAGASLRAWSEILQATNPELATFAVEIAEGGQVGVSPDVLSAASQAVWPQARDQVAAAFEAGADREGIVKALRETLPRFTTEVEAQRQLDFLLLQGQKQATGFEPSPAQSFLGTLGAALVASGIGANIGARVSERTGFSGEERNRRP